MLSLRTLARSAPRSAGRIASSTSTTSALLRPAFRSAVRQQTATLPRCFSTTFPRFDAASQELAAKLDSEIAVESAEDATTADSNTNIAAFLDQNSDWALQDVEGEQDVMLSRKYDDELITVAFNIVDFNTPMMEDESDEALLDEDEVMETGASEGRSGKNAERDDMADQDEFDEQPAFPASVNVLIQRPNKGALRVNLIADNGVFSIQAVTHLAASSASAAELLRDTPETLYTGPPFQQLDEEVQGMIETYLDARGINTALALFIPEYIDVKEQKEYLGWLSRVKTFVE